MPGYDVALRERVIRAVERGASAREAAARFEVGHATASRWIQRWRSEGHVEPSPRLARGSILDDHAQWLAELRAAEPELSLRAVSERLEEERGLGVHETTLWYWLRRQGITHKKRR